MSFTLLKTEWSLYDPATVMLLVSGGGIIADTLTSLLNVYYRT